MTSPARDTGLAPDEALPGDIRDLWEAELGRADFTTADDLFDLGATSLQAMRVIGSIAVRYRVEVPLPMFFTNPTVEGLTNAVRTLRASERT